MTNKIFAALGKQGIYGSARKAAFLAKRKCGYLDWRFRKVPKFANPTPSELDEIEQALRQSGIQLHDLNADPQEFAKFQAEQWFPDNYHGGPNGNVWQEKLLEHWLSSKFLDLKGHSSDDIYLDIAAASSPWVCMLRQRTPICAYAIDLCEAAPAHRDLPYYRVENATHTSFSASSVQSASLHCAYEMFTGDDDILLIHEAARILKPGGRMIILPLYMHTHYCAYSTPDFHGLGRTDPQAKEYVLLDACGIPSSRKYDAPALQRRVLSAIINDGMQYRIWVLRNKHELGNSIYCHFILEIER